MIIPLESLTTFFAASMLLALAPGPDNIFVLTQSALQGKAAGLVVTVGLCTGLVVHTTAVAFGVAAIFQASSLAFTVLKLIGAGYLTYLAWQVFRSSAAKISTNSSRRIKIPRLYRRGIIMNITNPKVSIFFLAFLPQFADPERGPLKLQIMLLGALFIISTLIVFGGISFVAGSLGEWLNRSQKIQRILNWIAGSIFLGLAVKLAITER